jgi:hypothetical protein
MATWEYGEMLLESVAMSDDGDWRTKSSLTWHDPADAITALKNSAVANLNLLGGVGWELAGVTRNQIEERFQIKVVTTYHLKRRTG